MKHITALVAILFVTGSGLGLKGDELVNEARLMVLDPGHFHAALVQKEMYPWLAKRVSVYAPLGPDVIDYLNRIGRFNTRKEDPTSWEVELHTGPDFFERMLKERPGQVVIPTERNTSKIARIRASVKDGLHVLADKPWIIKFADMEKLKNVLNEIGRASCRERG